MSAKYSRLKEIRAGLGPAIKEVRFTLKRIRKSPLSIAGIAIILFFALIAIFAEVIAPPVARDPYMMWHDGYSSIPKPPGTPVLDPIAQKVGWTIHLLGTSEMQYDLFYGIIWGTRTAFRIGVVVEAIAVILGILIGSISGYYGGVIDEIMMRFTDVVLAFPGLILSMALVIALPRVWPIDFGFVLILIALSVGPTIVGYILKVRSRWMLVSTLVAVLLFIVLDIWVFGTRIWTINLELGQIDKVLIALALIGWPGYCRVIRGETFRVKQEAYVEAAKAVGCSDLRIIVRHILPNSIYPVIIMASLGIGGTVLTAAALSFLGIGAPAGYADWGQMIAFARNWIWAGFQNPWQYWYTFTIPGIAIFFFVLGWNLLGDAFRDVLDPTLRRR
jgi:peptide/nickel transport system permease protein